MRETRNRSGTDRTQTSTTSKSTTRRTKESEDVTKTTPGRGRPRNADQATPAQKVRQNSTNTDDVSSQNSTSRSLRPGVSPPSSTSTKDDSQVSQLKPTSKRKRNGRDSASPNISIEGSESSPAQKKTKSCDPTPVTSISSIRSGTETDTGKRTADEAQIELTQTTSSSNTKILKSTDNTTSSTDKIKDNDGEETSISGNSDEKSTESTQDKVPRSRGRPRKSTNTPDPKTVPKSKPSNDTPKTESNTSSPRRSSRSFVPNRKFQDLDVEVPKKKKKTHIVTVKKEHIPEIQKLGNQESSEKELTIEGDSSKEESISTNVRKEKEVETGVGIKCNSDINIASDETSVRKVIGSTKLANQNMKTVETISNTKTSETPPSSVKWTESRHAVKSVTYVKGRKTTEVMVYPPNKVPAPELSDKANSTDMSSKTIQISSEISQMSSKATDESSKLIDTSSNLKANETPVKAVVGFVKPSTTSTISSVYQTSDTAQNKTTDSPKGNSKLKTALLENEPEKINKIKAVDSETKDVAIASKDVAMLSKDVAVLSEEVTITSKALTSNEVAISSQTVAITSKETITSKELANETKVDFKADAAECDAKDDESNMINMESDENNTENDMKNTGSEVKNTESDEKEVSNEEKDGTGTLIKQSLALLDTSEDENIIIDTPVCTPSTSSDSKPFKPGKIVRPVTSVDRTICVSVAGKSDKNNDTLRNVMVKIPGDCSGSPLQQTSEDISSAVKFYPKQPAIPVKPIKISYKQMPVKTIMPPPTGPCQKILPSSMEQEVKPTDDTTQTVIVDPVETNTSVDTQSIDNMATLQSKVIIKTSNQTIQSTFGSFDPGSNVIKVEYDTDKTHVSAETQTPTCNVGKKENKYKKVFREIGSKKIIDVDNVADNQNVQGEEVIMVELPEGAEIKREIVTEEKLEHPEFVSIDEHGLYQCKFCSYATYKKSNWYKHKSKHLAMRSHQCPHCSYRAATSSNLKRHVAIHSDVRDFHCNICQLNFRQKIHLERHLKYKHQEKTVQCPLCPYVCANENPDLKVHIRRRHMPMESMNAYTCEECGLVTVSKKDLRQHMKFHRKGPELKLFCEHCSFVTDCESRLRRHLFIHTKEKPFQCGLCEYKGSQKEHVLRHMKSQHNIEIERERSYRRSPSSSFDTDSTQEVVISNSNEKADYSSEEKIFACNHCTMKFSKLINLYKHLHTQHRGVMPDCSEEFTCVVCDFRTNNKKNLLVHMRKHNTQDQSPPSHVYSCVLCRYINPRRRNLFQHMKKKHHIEIVMKDDGSTNCFVADSTNVREDSNQQMIGGIAASGSQNAEIEIISDGDGSLNLHNVISLEDIAMVVSNPLSNSINTDPISVTNITSAPSTVTSITEHEAAEAIEGLQALAEQAGLVETLVDNVIEEPVQDMAITDDNQLLIDESTTDTIVKQEVSIDQSDQSIQLSSDQLLNLTSGDYVEINGEMYKVEISSEEKNASKEANLILTE
ncbi:hypothetical protein SNE40_019077 [Patella caerulea]|uniref:C2H2-type domain-containing protein n=1 Tax=Patella caerulea TaxID=87958 RepID=A0AAN8J674_PATCE